MAGGPHAGEGAPNVLVILLDDPVWLTRLSTDVPDRRNPTIGHLGPTCRSFPFQAAEPPGSGLIVPGQERC